MPRATGRPAFPGAKTALLPLLWAALASVVPANQWPQLTFIDAFLGSGAGTADAKARFATVYANDIAPRSTLIGRALFQNVSQALAPANVLALARPPADAAPARRPCRSPSCPRWQTAPRGFGNTSIRARCRASAAI